MNAKLSLSMNKLLLMAALTLGFQGLAAAQTVYDRLEAENLWNLGGNPAGLVNSDLSLAGALKSSMGFQSKTQAVSFAQLYGSFEHGGFRSASEAETPWTMGAETKSLARFGKVTMRGGFSFEQKEGSGMDGSMFMNPGQYPVDLLEFTPGRKTRQTYTVDGSIATKLDGHWTIGGSFDFLSANYSKRKDIRHTNYALDLKVAPSLLYRFSDKFDIGLSYIFRKTSESVKAEQIGSATAESYYGFLDKGIYYGVYDVWDGSSLHMAEAGVDRFPVKEIFNGGSLQLRYGLFYADVSYLKSQGEIGERGYSWYKFPGGELSAHAGCKIVKPQATHLFGLEYSYRGRDNDEYIVERVTTGGVTSPVVHGKNRIFEHRDMAIRPSYRLYASSFEISAKASYEEHRLQSSLVFPYLNTWDWSTVSADVNAIWHLSSFDLGAGASFLTSLKDDLGSDMVEGTLPSSEPYRLTEWFNMDREYKTAGRCGLRASVRWNFSIASMKGLYLKAEGFFTRASKITYLDGSSRYGASLRLGCEF